MGKFLVLHRHIKEKIMALTKETEAYTTVLPDGRLAVKTVTHIMENGEVISSSNHRKVIEVGADTSGEAQIVQDIAAKIHNAPRKAARASILAQDAHAPV